MAEPLAPAAQAQLDILNAALPGEAAASAQQGANYNATSASSTAAGSQVAENERRSLSAIVANHGQAGAEAWRNLGAQLAASSDQAANAAAANTLGTAGTNNVSQGLVDFVRDTVREGGAQARSQAAGLAPAFAAQGGAYGRTADGLMAANGQLGKVYDRKFRLNTELAQQAADVKRQQSLWDANAEVVRAKEQDRIAAETPKAPEDLTEGEMGDMAFAQGIADRDAALLAMEAELNKHPEGSPKRLALGLQLAGLNKKPEKAWQNEAAIAMFGLAGSQMFYANGAANKAERALSAALLAQGEEELKVATANPNLKLPKGAFRQVRGEGWRHAMEDAERALVSGGMSKEEAGRKLGIDRAVQITHSPGYLAYQYGLSEAGSDAAVALRNTNKVLAKYEAELRPGEYLALAQAIKKDTDRRASQSSAGRTSAEIKAAYGATPKPTVSAPKATATATANAPAKKSGTKTYGTSPNPKPIPKK